jgi:hypothetical protein
MEAIACSLGRMCADIMMKRRLIHALPVSLFWSSHLTKENQAFVSYPEDTVQP